MIGISALCLALLVALIANVHGTKTSDSVEPPRSLADYQLPLQEPTTKSTVSLDEPSIDFPDSGTVQQSEHDQRRCLYFLFRLSPRISVFPKFLLMQL